MEFRGSFPALVTPFCDGVIDWTALEALVEAVIEGGSAGVVPCGTTGESPALTHEEHDRVVFEVVRMAKGRVPVLAGTGSNSTAEAVRLTRHAKEAGADAALVVSPYYNKPTQEGLYRHFMTVADEGGLPIVLYDIPGRCAVELSLETIERLSRHPRIRAIKEATGRVAKVSEILSVCDLTVLSGDDNLTLPICALGGRGVVSVLANLLPSEISRLVALCLEGDLVEARKLHDRLFPLMKAMFLETNPLPIKTALALEGRCAEEFRPPLYGMEAGNRERLASMLESRSS